MRPVEGAVGVVSSDAAQNGKNGSAGSNRAKKTVPTGAKALGSLEKFSDPSVLSKIHRFFKSLLENGAQDF